MDIIVADDKFSSDEPAFRNVKYVGLEPLAGLKIVCVLDPERLSSGAYITFEPELELEEIDALKAQGLMPDHEDKLCVRCDNPLSISSIFKDRAIDLESFWDLARGTMNYPDPNDAFLPILLANLIARDAKLEIRLEHDVIGFYLELNKQRIETEAKTRNAVYCFKNLQLAPTASRR
jgi:hypothetical protein